MDSGAEKTVGRNHGYMLDRWKKKSASYPRYNGSEEIIEAQICRSMKRAGVDFTGKSVLDVGCGTGVYTIRFAKEAESVTGIDISQEMLAVLNRDAAEAGCMNIETIIHPWDTFEIDGRKWDVAVSTMTPAVQLPEDYQKIFDCANESVVYLGWGGRRDVEPIKYIVGKDRKNIGTFNNAEKMRSWLEQKGIAFYSEIFDEERIKQMSMAEAVGYCLDELEINDISVDSGEVERELLRFQHEDGSIRFKINVRLELIVYKK